MEGGEVNSGLFDILTGLDICDTVSMMGQADCLYDEGRLIK
jgi:hypothetical protein